MSPGKALASKTCKHAVERFTEAGHLPDMHIWEFCKFEGVVEGQTEGSFKGLWG